MQRFVYYAGWIVFIGLVLYFGLSYQNLLKQESTITFDMRPFLFFTCFFPVFVGILLKLPSLIRELKAGGKWHYDWVKALTIGLPAFYVTILPILTYLTSFGMKLPLAKEIMTMVSTESVITISGLVLGYLLLDCLKGKESS
ncbi:hypothetical protein [Salirhabdus sp. Marseille-P4669]|uniref:hypothetical protein n=1 Tax=Salirhabdus sp. Marseille-P4669 TaxID=2042310 RepID=UPI000C7C583A|nr:hypothetical protein [Salirhabdus sp. Marseille-P4669]